MSLLVCFILHRVEDYILFLQSVKNKRIHWCFFLHIRSFLKWRWVKGLSEKQNQLFCKASKIRKLSRKPNEINTELLGNNMGLLNICFKSMQLITVVAHILKMCSALPLKHNFCTCAECISNNYEIFMRAHKPCSQRNW